MRVISINLNGIRSAATKGFFSWVAKQHADFICCQEIRAHESQLLEPIFQPSGYHAYFVSAKQKGYSGVAIYSKYQPISINTSLGWDHSDLEGRYLQLNFANLSVASIYLPSGTSNDARQTIKYDFLRNYTKVLKSQLLEAQNYIICGDFNIAHHPIDLKNWRANQKNSGFLPEERAWLDMIFNELGFIDSFRYKYPDKVAYTWWSNRANAWANNVGWRIDYQILTPDLAPTIKEITIYKDTKFSDHAPLIVDYDYSITT
jgi:exodeoxyribonuclease III